MFLPSFVILLVENTWSLFVEMEEQFYSSFGLQTVLLIHYYLRLMNKLHQMFIPVPSSDPLSIWISWGSLFVIGAIISKTLCVMKNKFLMWKDTCGVVRIVFFSFCEIYIERCRSLLILNQFHLYEKTVHHNALDCEKYVCQNSREST